LRGGEGERSSGGRQDGVGPVAQGHVGAATFGEDEGHESVFLCCSHRVVAGQTLYPSHDGVESVCQESTAARHVGQDTGYVPPTPPGSRVGAGPV